MEAYVILTSIDPVRKRNRAYAIALRSSARNANILIVCQSWGKGNPYRNRKVTYFEDSLFMERYILGLLTRRKRHGYTITSISGSFPDGAIPIGMVRSLSAVQLRLFEDSIAA